MFKKRILEEGFEQFRNFAKNNVGLLAGLSGAGLGALTSYLTGAPEEWQAERQAELNSYTNEGYKNDIDMEPHLVDRDKFGEAVERAKGSWFSFDSTDAAHLKNLAQQDPRFEVLNTKNEFVHPSVVMDNVKVQGFQIDPRLSQKENWEAYVQHVKSQVTPPDVHEAAKTNPDVAKNLKDYQHSAEHAKRDAYIGYMLGGAALGAGGHKLGKFAKRKLDERMY